MLPRVSVIIVSWNARALLQRFLPSVLATDYPDLELIVVDNGSDDGSADWVEAAWPGVTVLRLPENRLFCGGNNAALAFASGKYVVLLNNDVEVPSDWLRPLVARMEATPHLGALQPKMLQLDRTMFEYAGASGGHLDRFGYPFTRGRLFFSLEEDKGQYDDYAEVFWASGAALLLRREALDEVGVLDERFGMHMEEIDLCWRLWRAGWRVAVEPLSEVYHLGGGSLPQGSPRKAYYNFRNGLVMAYKNLTRASFRRLYTRRIALDLLAAGRALSSGNRAEAQAIARAHRDARRMMKHYAHAEREVLPFYRRSLVVDYFAQGRKRFADLPREAFEMP